MNRTTIAEAMLPHKNRIPMVVENRIGIIRVCKEFVECACCDAWNIIMLNVRIIEAKYDPFNDTIDYYCYSPWFDSHEVAGSLPEYVVEFRRNYETGNAELTGVKLISHYKEYIDDDKVLERIKATVRSVLSNG